MLRYVAICESCVDTDEILCTNFPYQRLTYCDFFIGVKCELCKAITDCSLAVGLTGLSKDRIDSLYFCGMGSRRST